MTFDGVHIRSKKHQFVKLVTDFELASSNPKCDKDEIVLKKKKIRMRFVLCNKRMIIVGFLTRIFGPVY